MVLQYGRTNRLVQHTHLALASLGIELAGNIAGHEKGGQVKMAWVFKSAQGCNEFEPIGFQISQVKVADDEVQRMLFGHDQGF